MQIGVAIIFYNWSFQILHVADDGDKKKLCTSNRAKTAKCERPVAFKYWKGFGEMPIEQ